MRRGLPTLNAAARVAIALLLVALAAAPAPSRAHAQHAQHAEAPEDDAAHAQERAQEAEAPSTDASRAHAPPPQMALRTTGELALFPALGYAPSLDHRGDAFVELELGAGIVIHSAFRHTMGVVRGERFGRTRGSALTAFLVGQVDLAVPRARRGHGGSLGLRLVETFFLGRHALALTASLGPRWDTTTTGTGLTFTAGLGYALVLPPWVVPILLELKWDRMPNEAPERALRVLLAWPLG